MHKEQGAEPVLLPSRRKPSITHLLVCCLLESFTRCCCGGTNPVAALLRTLLLGFSRDVRGLNETIILFNMCCSSVCTVKWRLSEFQVRERLLLLRGTNGTGCPGCSRSPAAPLACGCLEDTSTHPGSGQNIRCFLRFPAFQQKWVVRAVALGCSQNSALIPRLKRGQMLTPCRGLQRTQTSWWPGNCQLWVRILVTFYKAPFPVWKVSERTHSLKGIQNQTVEVKIQEPWSFPEEEYLCRSMIFPTYL